MKRTICVNKNSTYVVETLNEIVRTNRDVRDKIEKTQYLFWGSKIVENEFLWESARHVNNYYKIKGEIISANESTTEINISLVKRPFCYAIYILVVFFLLIAIVSKSIFFVIFSVVFAGSALGSKQNYFDEVERDIKKLLRCELVE